jgi:hypothetical protein
MPLPWLKSLIIQQVDDDFERFLVQYLVSGHEIKNNVSKDEWKALHMKLFEVVLPDAGAGEGKQAKEMMALMEQWYASMQALAGEPTNKEKNYYSLELGIANGQRPPSFIVRCMPITQLCLKKWSWVFSLLLKSKSRRMTIIFSMHTQSLPARTQLTAFIRLFR